MVQPAEQLEEAPDLFFRRLVESLQQAREARRGNLSLPTIEIDDTANATLESVREKLDALIRNRDTPGF